MTKSIYTLIPDIYALVGGAHGITDHVASDLAANVSSAVQRSFGNTERKGLRMSGLGDRCPCALWYDANHPELGEQLPPYAKIKYAYGHIIEHLVIALAKAAGHDVQGEQDELVLDGVVGHRDCVIDGAVVDVKSAASRSFLKFRDKTLGQDDPFGYLDQVDAYVLGSALDPLVTVKDRGFLLAVDKQLGHMVLYEHQARPEHITNRIRSYKKIVNSSKPPRCECHTVADGKSGNLRLDTKASYSAYKYCCNPSLRCFLYADGPRYLTKVIRIPDTAEVDKHGKIVYNG